MSNAITFEVMTASIMSRCDFNDSQISAQDTVGVAGDDIMYHILVLQCVFVRVCVSAYVCHDVYLDDLTLKEWCHTNNTLQVHSWWSLIVQVMFHTLMTSSMKSAGHKVSQSIFQLLSRSKAQNFENSHGYLTGIFNSWRCSREKSLTRPQSGGHFENLKILKY